MHQKAQQMNPPAKARRARAQGGRIEQLIAKATKKQHPTKQHSTQATQIQGSKAHVSAQNRANKTHSVKIEQMMHRREAMQAKKDAIMQTHTNNNRSKPPIQMHKSPATRKMKNGKKSRTAQIKQAHRNAGMYNMGRVQR